MTQATGAPIPAPPLPGCVTLDKSLQLSMPRFPHLPSGYNRETRHQVWIWQVHTQLWPTASTPLWLWCFGHGHGDAPQLCECPELVVSSSLAHLGTPRPVHFGMLGTWLLHVRHLMSTRCHPWSSPHTLSLSHVHCQQPSCCCLSSLGWSLHLTSSFVFSRWLLRGCLL